MIANIGLFLNDLVFYLVVYFPNNYLINLSSLNFIVDLIPYFVWVIAILIFLPLAIMKNTFEFRFFMKMLSFFILFNAIVIFLCLSSIQYALSVFSWESVVQILSYIAESVIFDLAILGLIYSANHGLSFILSGLIVLISGDFLIDYAYLSQVSTFRNYGELLWLLGLSLMLFGLYEIENKATYAINLWSRIQMRSAIR